MATVRSAAGPKLPGRQSQAGRQRGEDNGSAVSTFRSEAHSGSVEAAGTILDAVWRKVRCFPDPAASTISPRTGRFLGVSRGLRRTGSVVASDGAITTCDHNS